MDLGPLSPSSTYKRQGMPNLAYYTIQIKINNNEDKINSAKTLMEKHNILFLMMMVPDQLSVVLFGRILTHYNRNFYDLASEFDRKLMGKMSVDDINMDRL